MSTDGTNGDDSASPETNGSAGRPTVRRARVAAGELSPGSARRPQPAREARAGAEQPSGRAKDVVPRSRPAASAASSATAPDGRGAAAGGTNGPSTSRGATAEELKCLPVRGEAVAFGGASPGDPDAPDGAAAQDGQEPGRPARRRARYLLAVAGVVAVLLVVLPLMNRGNGPDHGKNAAAGPTAGRTTAPQSPDGGLVDLPGNLRTASAAPTEGAGRTKQPAVTRAPGVTGLPAHAPRSAAPSSSTAGRPKKTTGSAPSALPASLTVKPVARLANGSPWKTDRMQLGMQADGNLVLYDWVGKRVMWAAGTSGPGNVAYFQSDGNLVVYNSRQAVWASNPAGFTNPTLVLRSDGNLVIMSGGKQVWASNSHF